MEIVTFAVVLVLCSITSSNAETATPIGGAGGEGDAHKMPCIKKLMPCQPYLHSTAAPPPPACCVPLKEIVDNDVTCLCAVFNNVNMLKSLNLTKDNALDLPKACGTNADISKCKDSAGNTTHPSTSPATAPPASLSGTNESDSTGGSASSTGKTTSSAQTINFAGLSFSSAFVATLFL